MASFSANVCCPESRLCQREGQITVYNNTPHVEGQRGQEGLRYNS